MVGFLDVYSYSYGTDHLKTEHSEPFKMAALTYIVLFISSLYKNDLD